MHQDQCELINQASIVIQLFVNLGFVINTSKSVTSPTQCLEFLGFILDSTTMTISLPPTKLEKIKNYCKIMITKKIVARRSLATLVGLMTSASLAVRPAPLHYRGLQRMIIKVVDHNNWDVLIPMSNPAMKDLLWWIQEGSNWVSAPIVPPLPQVVIKTDASHKGWGAVCGNTRSQGPWTKEQVENCHINVLETLAIKYGLLALCPNRKNVCIKILTDNTTAMSYILKKGGTKVKEISDIALDCWDWALSRGITLIINHIPGIENVLADKESRIFTDPSDWQLNPMVCEQIQKMWGRFYVDLFASLWNRQTEKFLSWKPQPYAAGQDAFNHAWPKTGSYAFPPWNLIPKVLQKINAESLSLVLITPLWPRAVWYSHLLQMCTELPLLLPVSRHILKDPAGHYPDTLKKKFQLVAWKLSGEALKVKGFQTRLQNLSVTKTVAPPINSTTTIGNNGIAGVINRGYLRFQHI